MTAQRDLTLHDNFIVACGSWQELTLAGVIALEMGAPHSNFATRVERRGPPKRTTTRCASERFDFVVGLHPDKGGLFRVENQLAIWFPTAKVLLV